MIHGQISLFDGSSKFYINKPIRLIELFAGYGSQNLALKYLGINYESWKICEWAVKSIQAYKDLHHSEDNEDYAELNGLGKVKLEKILFNYGISADYNEPMTMEQIKRLGFEKQKKIFNNIMATNNLVNIQKATAVNLEIYDTDKYDYLMTYSFPCQDLSLAGKGKGMSRDGGTRSGMLWEVERILNECEELPQILLMENVPQVHGKGNMQHFVEWQEFLESKGYKNYCQDLNAKDYGIPQSRNRTFMISLLGDYRYEFPKKIKLEKRLKDLLEDSVDENGFHPSILVDESVKESVAINFLKEKDNILNSDKEIYQCDVNSGWQDNKIGLKISPTLRALNESTYCLNNLRIRKLTPKECFRLMGVKDTDFELVARNQSNASLYHLAGDSIVVNVLMEIFKKMIKGE